MFDGSPLMDLLLTPLGLYLESSRGRYPKLKICVPRTGNGAGQLKMLNNKNERAPAPMLGYFPVPPSTKQFTSGWHAVQLRPIRPSYGGRSGPRTAEIFQHSVKFQSRLGLGGQVSIEIILRSLKYGRWTGF